LSSLIDIQEDLVRGFIKVPTNNSNADPNNIESVITKEEFYRLKTISLKGVVSNSTAFFDANMPFIQQLACFMYTNTRVLCKGFLKAQYPKQIPARVSEGSI